MNKLSKSALIGLALFCLNADDFLTLAQELEKEEPYIEYVDEGVINVGEIEPMPVPEPVGEPVKELSEVDSSDSSTNVSSENGDLSSLTEYKEEESSSDLSHGVSESTEKEKDETELELPEGYQINHEEQSDFDINAGFEDVIVTNTSERTMAIEYFSGFSRNITTDQFIAEIGEHAREIAYKNDLYASVMIAQAILESGGGTSGLSNAPYNNLFGIKGVSAWGSVDMRTAEQTSAGEEYHIVATFRAYPSQYESLLDYANLMLNSGLYGGVRKSISGSPYASADALQGIYATDVNYSAKVKNLIDVYDLTRFDVYKEKEKRDSNFIPTKYTVGKTQLRLED